DAFAQFTTSGWLDYPALPESRYVFEVELTVNKLCHLGFWLGDPSNVCVLSFSWVPDREKIECRLESSGYGVVAWSGHRGFTPGWLLNLTLVVGDHWQTLFHENPAILAANCWPSDCCLRIGVFHPASAVIHRCSLRRLTARDVAACGRLSPPTRLAID